jgi:uncharacterized protein (TIGR02611 family)
VYHRIVKTLKQARRLIVAVVGFTILLIGVVMIVTPGPSILVIPLGLGILATEFVWARNLLDRFKAMMRKSRSPENKNAD